MRGSTEEGTSREEHSGKASQKYYSSIIPYPKPLRPNVFWYSEFKCQYQMSFCKIYEKFVGL